MGGGIDPSPTNERKVSGRRLNVSMIHVGGAYKITGTRTTPQKMVRNQKIDRQPRVYANTPPSTGPTARLAASGMVLYHALAVLNVPANWKIPTNFPLSCGREISAITPVPSAIVADPPAAYDSARFAFARYQTNLDDTQHQQ